MCFRTTSVTSPIRSSNTAKTASWTRTRTCRCPMRRSWGSSTTSSERVSAGKTGDFLPLASGWYWFECVSAGFDTISTALSWALVYLVSYPEIQERLQRELSESERISTSESPLKSFSLTNGIIIFLDEKIGMDRTPRLSDRTDLPYLEAFILEIFRHSSFLPFTIPHWWVETAGWTY